MTQGFDDLDREEILDLIAPLSDIRDSLFKLSGQAQDFGNPEYEAFTIQIPRGEIAPLLGFDMSRVRAYFFGSEAGVLVGKRENLSGASIDQPQGFPLPFESPGIEFKSIDEIYCKFVGVTATVNTFANVYVLVEKSAQ